MPSNIKTVAFFGASTGVGLSALKHTLAAGHQCIALCRTPSKLTKLFSPDTTPNLRIVEGNAHDLVAVSKCLETLHGTLVDHIVTTIGNKPDMSQMVKGSMGDPEVCQRGMSTLLLALVELRARGVTGKPHIVMCSTTGLSRYGRDWPLALFPIYSIMLKTPHEDKRISEDRLVDSRENFTIIRPSLLTDGETNKMIRVGIEDPKNGVVSKVVGYTISREDTGRWVAENLILATRLEYVNKATSITY